MVVPVVQGGPDRGSPSVSLGRFSTAGHQWTREGQWGWGASCGPSCRGHKEPPRPSQGFDPTLAHCFVISVKGRKVAAHAVCTLAGACTCKGRSMAQAGG